MTNEVQQASNKPEQQQRDTKKPEQRQRDMPALLPRVDVREDRDGITLLADLPGVPKDRLELKVEGDLLQIEGEIAPDTPENMEAVYAEIQLSHYRRAFTLSSELDTARIEAQFRDGVLQLRIPKHEHAQPKRIEVKVD